VQVAENDHSVKCTCIFAQAGVYRIALQMRGTDRPAALIGFSCTNELERPVLTQLFLGMVCVLVG